MAKASEDDDDLGGDDGDHNDGEDTADADPSFDPPARERTRRHKGRFSREGGPKLTEPVADGARITRQQAARRLQKHPNTLVRWEREGRLTPVKDEQGMIWYPTAEVEDLLDDEGQEEMGATQIIRAANGIIGQQMRHGEIMQDRMTAMTGAFLTSIQTIMTQQQDWATKSAERAAKLEAELDAARDTIQRATDGAAAREIQVAESIAKGKRQDRIVDSVVPYIPVIAGFMGKKLGISPEVTGEPIVEELVRSLTEDQLPKLQAILTPFQMARVGLLYDLHKPKEEEEKKEGAGDGK